MSRLYSLLMSLMLLLTLGMAQAPQVCVGDGQGAACRPEACACVAACSCQAAHARDRAAAEASCCTVETTAEASCHGPDQVPHFAPPEKHWHALVPAWPALPAAWPRGAQAPLTAARPAHRPQAPPEKVPLLA